MVVQAKQLSLLIIIEAIFMWTLAVLPPVGT